MTAVDGGRGEGGKGTVDLKYHGAGGEKLDAELRSKLLLLET
jgi:hypothetical protein